jgi:hypothetical protein
VKFFQLKLILLHLFSFHSHVNKLAIRIITFTGAKMERFEHSKKVVMPKKAKADFVATDKAIAGRHDAKSQDTKAPAFVPEAVLTKQPPPDDAMVQQILERQAVFGF